MFLMICTRFDSASFMCEELLLKNHSHVLRICFLRTDRKKSNASPRDVYGWAKRLIKQGQYLTWIDSAMVVCIFYEMIHSDMRHVFTAQMLFQACINIFLRTSLVYFILQLGMASQIKAPLSLSSVTPPLMQTLFCLLETSICIVNITSCLFRPPHSLGVSYPSSIVR
jgi:hypothetical protein